MGDDENARSEPTCESQEQAGIALPLPVFDTLRGGISGDTLLAGPTRISKAIDANYVSGPKGHPYKS